MLFFRAPDSLRIEHGRSRDDPPRFKNRRKARFHGGSILAGTRCAISPASGFAWCGAHFSQCLSEGLRTDGLRRAKTGSQKSLCVGSRTGASDATRVLGCTARACHPWSSGSLIGPQLSLYAPSRATGRRETVFGCWRVRGRLPRRARIHQDPAEQMSAGDISATLQHGTMLMRAHAGACIC